MACPNWLSFPSIEVKQPIGTFYICVINSRDLVKIAYSDVRRLKKRDVERYLGIERPLSQSRVEELKAYVNSIDATFPSSIIVAVESDNAKYDESKKRISIRNDFNVAKIIDGQHRIAGLEDYTREDFQLIITMFIDMELEDQAMVFATINLKQTKVSKSLAYDLYEYTKNRSPQKTCHNIVRLLNREEKSPFRKRIKILGVATGAPEESITQATFVERLLKYITRDARADRDLIKKGKTIGVVAQDERKELIFRNLFKQEKDAYIAKNIWNYFDAVKAKWPVAWTEVRRGNILNRTTGFGALMRYLKDIYLFYNNMDQVLSIGEYLERLKPINLNDGDFTSETFKPGTSGETELYRQLRIQSGLNP